MISHIRDTVSQVTESLCQLELEKTLHETLRGTFNYIGYRNVMKASQDLFAPLYHSYPEKAFSREVHISRYPSLNNP